MTVLYIAADLGLSAGSVKRYLSDGVGKLRTVLSYDVVITDDPAPAVHLVHGRTAR